MRNPILIFVLALLTTSVFAEGLKNGKWEITSKAEMQGVPANMPAHTVSICINQQSAEAGKPPIPADKSCSFSDYKVSNGEASWKMECKGQMTMKGTGHIKFTDTAYSGSSEMEMGEGEEAMKMKQSFTAKRVGDC